MPALRHSSARKPQLDATLPAAPATRNRERPASTEHPHPALCWSERPAWPAPRRSFILRILNESGAPFYYQNPEKRRILPSWKRKTGDSFRRKNMTDLIFILVVVLFFVVSGLYVRFCEKL
jgi:hypothetical protein